MKKQLTVLLFGVTLALPSAFADQLLVPGTQFPPTFQAPDTDLVSGGLGSLTFLASTGVQNFSASTISGTYSESVYLDPTPNSTVGCSDINGCLDFVLRFTVDAGSAAIGTVTTDDFTGFNVDAGILNGSTDVSPTFLERTPSGQTIRWHFNSATAGSVSDILIAETNATAFATSILSFQDGSTANAAGYMPLNTNTQVVTPEPASYALIGFGLAGLGLIRRRKTNQ